MKRIPVRPRAVLAVIQGGLLLGGLALADGAPPRSGSGGGDTVVARTTYRCMGGVRVQVNQLAGSARVRVDFGGQSRFLTPTPTPGGMQYQNVQLAWITEGKQSSLKEKASGHLALRGCMPVTN